MKSPKASYSYLLVGAGWRSPFFIKPSQLFPEHFRLTGVVARNPEARENIKSEWDAPTWATLDEALAAEKPDFIVAAVSWDSMPIVIADCVGRGIPVLAETPPAPNLEALHELWAKVGASGLVQVAEQYPLYPGHVARKAVIDAGHIGSVNEVEVSSTHMYHATALIRHMLGVTFEAARVTGIRNTHPLANPLGVPGWNDNTEPEPATTVRGLVEFENGQVGTYDFTDNQWWNPLRVDRMVVRGSLGEIANERVTALTAPRTIITSHLERRRLGEELNLEGLGIDHITHGTEVVYTNRWKGHRLSDDEIAVTELLRGMGEWIHDDAAAPYPLAEAAQDWSIALAIEEAAATGERVDLPVQPWAAQ